MKPGSKNTDVILSVNSGSSTIKFALYPVVERQVDPAILSGFVEGLEPGGDTQICFKSDQFNQQFSLQNAHLSDEEKFDQSLVRLRSLLQEHSDGMNVIAVAHRIVHGGDVYSASVVVDENALRYLHTLDSLAPLHQPHNLKGVEAFRRAYPQVPQIACFDTGFHAEMPEVETTLALPEVIRKNGIRRYGFHGLSYRYVAGKLMQNSSRASQKVIMAHLGNGASACAMLNGKSQATSMGFSALDGLMMGTRCGALDPGVILHLAQQGWDAGKLEKLLYKESGLLGVSGISADMRTLRASGEPQAQKAIDLFTYRVIREFGALSACLHGVDAIAFTGGIGEHDAVLREQVCRGLSHLGLSVDADKNGNARGDSVMAIHDIGSRIEIWVIPTDEGRIAAMDAANLVCAQV